MKYQYINSQEPENFDAKFVCVSVFVRCADEILLLQRQDSKFEGNKWGGPAGKFEDGLDENWETAALRELEEETGIDAKISDLEYLGKHFVRYPEVDFLYPKWEIVLDEKPEIRLSSDEHKNFRWVKISEIENYDLVLGEDEIVEFYYGI